jgi:hypothetical protein
MGSISDSEAALAPPQAYHVLTVALNASLLAPMRRSVPVPAAKK